MVHGKVLSDRVKEMLGVKEVGGVIDYVHIGVAVIRVARLVQEVEGL